MLLRKWMTGAALAAVVTVGACAGAPQQTGDVTGFEERTILTVENNNWADMTMYLVRDGVRARLGHVTSMGRGRFVVPAPLLSGAAHVRIMADPIGSSQYWMSQPIMITPGAQVSFRLENNVQLSSFMIR